MVGMVYRSDSADPSDIAPRDAANIAWAHYRKTYAPNPSDMAVAHKAFHAGWEAAVQAMLGVWEAEGE